ncbi:MAG: TolC family protein, partial [Thermoguttaceae bacterium]
ENSEVVRVLAGNGATSSGRTVYDPAIANTQVDAARGRFDPALVQRNRFNRQRLPQPRLDAGDPSGVSFSGDPIFDYDMALGVEKTTTGGGTAGVDVAANPTRIYTTDPLLLNPQSRSAVDFRFTQPLMQGAGRAANLAPIMLARIDTERSFYQLKLSVQQLVQSVINAYWSLVFARTDVVARRTQTQQGFEAYQRATANLELGRGNIAEKAQAQSAWANFRAVQISAESSVLQSEQALRDILGLDPYEPIRIVPVTPPQQAQVPIDWNRIVDVAEANRCDLVQLKLILEADQQRLIVAQNTAQPSVDATALYRFNGLEGRTPSGDFAVADPGDFTGWQLGVDVSLPLGLREARAELRRQELNYARDRANLHEGLRQASQALARRYRNLSQYYQEYLAVKEARLAARINYEVQWENYVTNRTIYLNVLQAITSWGNAVSAEAQSLLQYNSELAALDLETGLILELHGIRFYEEGFRSKGPAGRLGPERCYPRAMVPGENTDRYPVGDQPSENVFNLGELAAPRRE